MAALSKVHRGQRLGTPGLPWFGPEKWEGSGGARGEGTGGRGVCLVAGWQGSPPQKVCRGGEGGGGDIRGQVNAGREWFSGDRPRRCHCAAVALLRGP